MINKIIEILVVGLGVIALVVIIALLLSLPVMLLWNWLMPLIFGLKTITWLQALGLLILSGFLFRSTSTSSK